MRLMLVQYSGLMMITFPLNLEVIWLSNSVISMDCQLAGLLQNNISLSNSNLCLNSFITNNSYVGTLYYLEF